MKFYFSSLYSDNKVCGKRVACTYDIPAKVGFGLVTGKIFQWNPVGFNSKSLLQATIDLPPVTSWNQHVEK